MAWQDTVPWTFHQTVLLEGSGAGYCKILQLFRPATARCNQAISWVANVCHFSLVFLVFLPLLWPLFLLVLTWYYDSKLVPAILASQTLWSKKLLLPYLLEKVYITPQHSNGGSHHPLNYKTGFLTPSPLQN